MAIKVIIEGIPENIPDVEETWHICLLNKATKIPRGPTTDVSKFASGFMLQMEFYFLNVERIYGFTSTFVAICFATPYPIVCTSRSKLPALEILNFLVTTLINQDNKVAFIRVDEDGTLARSSEFMNTCHNMNIIVQTIGRDEFCLNGKSESSNKTIANITRAHLLNSSHKK